MKTRILILTTLILAAIAAPVNAKTHHHRRHARPHCHAGHHAKRVRITRHYRVKARRHGHIIRRHGHVVYKHRVRHVYIWRCVRNTRHHATTTTPVQSAPVTPPAPVSTPAPTTQVVRATIDPSYTQDAADNLKVTWTYSASVTDGSLPDGNLSLTVQEPNAAGPSGGCTIPVGGSVYQGTCTIELPAYGNWNVTVSYVGSSSTVAPNTSTDTEKIEPLPATVDKTWGTDAPSNHPSVDAKVVGSTAAVTVTDSNYEGATSVGVKDDLGDTCTANVSGTTATCNMPVTGTPHGFTINYPGGTSTTATQNVADGGVQQVTTNWPAQTINVNNPTVSVQQASVFWCGGYGGGWSASCQSPTPDAYAPPNPMDVAAGTRVELGASVVGNLSTDTHPQGYVRFDVSGPNGASYTEYDQSYNPSYSPGASEDCSMVESSPSQGVAPGLAGGSCLFVFNTQGTYQVTASYVSQDGNYASVTGPTETVNVG